MERPKFRGLQYFEMAMHRRHKKIFLLSEIQDCFDYFENHSSKVNVNERISLIHGSKIEIKRIDEGRGFAINVDGTNKILGKDQISREDQIEMIKKIRTITIPYARHIKARH